MEELPLRDIHLPNPISWWPLAPGWWLVIGIILLCIIFAVIILKYFMRPTLYKEAATALARIESEFQQHEDATYSIKEISALLRRVILSQNGSDKKGGITGHAWLEILDKNMNGEEFREGPGKLLLSGPYQENVDKRDVPELIELCRKWIKKL